jgi:hypothetical protein
MVWFLPTTTRVPAAVVLERGSLDHVGDSVGALGEVMGDKGLSRTTKVCYVLTVQRYPLCVALFFLCLLLGSGGLAVLFKLGWMWRKERVQMSREPEGRCWLRSFAEATAVWLGALCCRGMARRRRQDDDHDDAGTTTTRGTLEERESILGSEDGSCCGTLLAEATGSAGRREATSLRSEVQRMQEVVLRQEAQLAAFREAQRRPPERPPRWRRSSLEASSGGAAAIMRADEESAIVEVTTTSV